MNCFIKLVTCFVRNNGKFDEDSEELPDASCLLKRDPVTESSGYVTY